MRQCAFLFEWGLFLSGGCDDDAAIQKGFGIFQGRKERVQEVKETEVNLSGGRRRTWSCYYIVIM